MYGSVEGGRAAVASFGEPGEDAAEQQPQHWHKLLKAGSVVAVLALAYTGIVATKPSTSTYTLADPAASLAVNTGSTTVDNKGKAPSPPSAGAALHSTVDYDDVADEDDYEVVLDRYDFFEFPRVVEWLAKKGLHRDSTQAELSAYIPDKIVVKGRPNLIKHGGDFEYDEDVMAGYTMFSLAYDNLTTDYADYEAMDNTFHYDTYSASFQIIIDMYGKLISVAPTLYDLEDGGWTGRDMHFIALKPYELDPSYMIGVADKGDTEFGPAYLWNWKGDKDKKYIPLMNSTYDANTIDCHDIQAAFEEDAYWVPYTNTSSPQRNRNGFRKIHANGTVLAEYLWDHWYIADPNHVQLIEEDTVAIVSSRVTNSLLRINIKDIETGPKVPDQALDGSSIEWIMNGHNSSMHLTDETGAFVRGGGDPDWLFESQHNAEYMGDDMYYMVNDGMRVNSREEKIDDSELAASSLLIIQVKDESTTPAVGYNTSAHVTWKYDLGLFMSVYGDFDKLFTGNMLAAYWNNQDNTPTDDAQGFVEEITLDKEVAWSAHVYGNNSGKVMQHFKGWRIYSAERFYDSPVISGVSCEVDATEGTAAVEFTVHNNFRQNNMYHGAYTVQSADGKASKDADFQFAPYWGHNTLDLTLDSVTTCDGVVIVVTNQWGQSTNKTISTSL